MPTIIVLKVPSSSPYWSSRVCPDREKQHQAITSIISSVSSNWLDMATQPGHETSSVGHDAPSKSDIFATLCHLVSRIDAEDCMQELLVDCLSMLLDKSAAPVKCRDYVWHSLIKIGSTAKVLAQNHTLDTGCLIHETGSPPGTYSISGDASLHVKTLREIENDQPDHSKEIVSWIHISHPNVVPVYSVFLDDGLKLSLVSPNITHGNICDYMRKHPEVPRMALVSDIASGLSYLHDHSIVHGGLYPACVLVSDEGQAMIANTSISSDPEDSESLPVCYSVPEFLGEEGVQPTESSNVWSFASLSYEIISDKQPFFQIAKEFHVFEPSERPPCLKVYQIIVGMGTHDERPIEKPIIGLDTLKSSVIDLEHAKSSLMGVLGSEAASSLRVPEHLCDSLLRLIPDTNKLEAAAVVVLKLSPDETQCLADFLDLLLEDLADWFSPKRKAARNLLSLIMISTSIIPNRYILNGVHYDIQKPVAVGNFGKAYKGRGLSVRVNVVSVPGSKKGRLQGMADWSHTSHHNILQFHGVFADDISGGSQNLCIVTPLWRNGNLWDYAPTLPQKKRIHLLLDVAVALSHVHTKLDYAFGNTILTTDKFLVSDQGRSVLAFFGMESIFTDHWSTKSAYQLRFTSPDHIKNETDDMWSFGGVCYKVRLNIFTPLNLANVCCNILLCQVLSGKPPYYQYTEDAEIQAAISKGKILRRPIDSDEGMEMINDDMWGLIEQCCSSDWEDRLTASRAMELITNTVEVEDNRPPAEQLPDASIIALRSRAEVNFLDIEALLDRIQVELLQGPLSKLLESKIKDVAAAAMELLPSDIQTLVDFLDLTLKDYVLKSEEQNCVLALLSKLTSLTQTFPQCYEVKGIQYQPVPIAEGGFGTVHRGSDLNMCVKVMSRLDTSALTEWVKELGVPQEHRSIPENLPCVSFHEEWQLA
ncbi:hypothetical protein NP233_g3710 [Leucocoprinus birnbaumii]|uniref:Protein kinase domain-containing protein n=1 Tax=Leucocoprinus birnbaumii TaxID=56174 RepID=A0AAD5YXS6_9AGAR|nr:hypothetical protein NP233_g3710 [Leucocoprinus birnbaumii]